MSGILKVKNGNSWTEIPTVQVAPSTTQQDLLAHNLYSGAAVTLGAYTVANGVFIKPETAKINNNSTIKLIVLKCKPDTHYTVWKKTTTILRVASGTKATPENGDSVTLLGVNDDDTTKPVSGFTGASDSYLYIQCWTNAASSSQKDIDKHIFSIVVTEDAPEEQKLSDTWKTHLDTKIASINSIQNSLPVGKRSLHFIFFTDYHLESNDRDLEPILQYLYDNTDAKYIIHGGDAMNHPAAETRTAGIARLTQFKNDFKHIWDDMDVIIGNHDWSTYNVASTYDSPPSHMLTLSQITNKWFVKGGTPVQNQSVYGDYYMDDDVAKVRYILIGATYKSNFEAGQLDWLAQTLESTPTDYDVLPIFHRFLGYNSGSGIHYITDENDPLFPHGVTADSRSAVITNLLTKFTNHQTIARSGVTYDYTSKTGSVIMALSGHVHCDLYAWFDYTDKVNWYSSHSGTKIPAVAVTCDSRSIDYVPGQNRVPITQAEYEAATKITRSSLSSGDVRRHAFDDVIVDLENRVIYLTRIGAGEDVSIAY